MKEYRKNQLLNFVQKFNLPTQQEFLLKLDIALTHKSYANEKVYATESPIINNYNERLEFLGDAILGMIIVKTLYLLFPKATEGELTQKKSQIISTPVLAKIGYEIGVQDLLLFGKGERDTLGNRKDSNIEDAVEAIIAAIYLTVGYKVCESFILSLWEPYIHQNYVLEETINYKSLLQEYLMKNNYMLPVYKILSSYGAEHEKEFIVGLFIDKKKCSVGKGLSRKKAEQFAAKLYLKKNNISI